VMHSRLCHWKQAAGFLEVSHRFPIGTHDEGPVDECAVNRLVVVVLQASLLVI
jgi:hypothetical protein